jgi:hypothetical protein
MLLAEPKRLTGRFTWNVVTGDLDQDGYWLIEVNDKISPHRMHVEARLSSSPTSFCVILLIYWAARYIPVKRLNVDPYEQEHVNRYKRPQAVPALVSGPRYFPWKLNRGVFQPAMNHLPFAVPLERKNHGLENGLRFLAGEANIDLVGVQLPDYPARKGLFG